MRLSDESATSRLAEFLAPSLMRGDVVTLSGGLGAGKTAFARALLRGLTGDAALEVPSPTFTLLQTYDAPNFPVAHFDLYRLGGPDELTELGFEQEIADSLTLIEWPDRAGRNLPADGLDIALRMAPGAEASARLVTLTGHGAWAGKLARLRAVHRLLKGAGWAEASRAFMLGDASTRAYERLKKPTGEEAILMISPPRPDGPAIRRGKPYSVIAKLAETVDAFVAVDEALRAHLLSAPQIYAADLDAGLLLIEDFGQRTVLEEGVPVPARYAEAAAALAHLHGRDIASALPVAPERTHHVPPYDLEALLIEVELLLDWYVPHMGGNLLAAVARADFLDAWTKALAPLLEEPATLTLRDYHSPNLMWLPGRDGIKRVGLIDFQDAVMGHPAYDMVSLAQDARVDIAPELELMLIGHYAAARKRAGAFDMAAFARAYAVLGAQRNTKIMGIFARLDRRDGKPGYLAHLPRVEAYVKRNLDHPVLADVKTWYETYLPRLFAT